MTVAGRTREWRVGSMEVLVAGLVVLALSAGTLRAFVVGRPDLATAATVFCGVFVQALPFLALGLVISGLIAAYVSPDRLARWLPRRTGAAILTAGVGGAALPGCESSATFGGTDLVVKMTTTKIATTGRACTPARGGVVAGPAHRPDGLRRTARTGSAGRRAHGHRGIAKGAVSPFPPLPAGRAPELPLHEVVSRADLDSTNALDGRLITVTGFTLKESDGIDLGRVVIICCAADARLARLHLRGPAAAEAATYAQETWLRVEGTVVPEPPDEYGTLVPTLTVSTVTPIPAPKNSYGY